MTSGSEYQDVTIRGVPLDLMRRVMEHSSELLREFKLIVAVGGVPATEVPTRLLDLIHSIEQTYAPFHQHHDFTLQQALASDYETLDVTYEVPTAMGEIFERVRRQFNAADDYCRTGNLLLTLASDEDVVRVRNWYLGEFARQLTGKDPMSWDEYQSAREANTASRHSS